MIHVAVAGASGRMGRVISGIILRDCGDMELSGALEAPGTPQLGEDAGILAGVGESGVLVTDSVEDALNGAAVLIDFTNPEASLSHLSFAALSKIPAVVGSTGLTEEQKERLRNSSNNIPLVWAPNMSVGVNLLFRLVKDVVNVLDEDFDVEISEIHHRFKKDSPSGTALRLGEIIAHEKGVSLDERGVFGRHGITGNRQDEEIGIMSHRAGDVVGEHTVIFGGMGERLELTHRAHTRETFGRGAVRAARWVIGRSPGLYDMSDVLGL